MKRKFLILLAALIAGSFLLQAEPVSESRAREIAMRVLAAQPATKATSGDVKLIWNGEDAATKAAAQPAFYVFGSDRGGFVIIAGDDNVQPVLAISETNEFMVEGMPANVKWWMDRMKYYVRSASADPEAKEQWAMFAETKSGPIAPASSVADKVERLTPEWDQGNNDEGLYGAGVHIYNAYCPTVGSSLTLTGCVATALGEILTYQSGIYGASMPTKGTGSVGGYSAEAGFVVPASYNLEITYDWEKLRTLSDIDSIKKVVDANTPEGNALLDNLGHLLADLGAIANSQYSVDMTGASTMDALVGLVTHLGYNKAAYHADAADYTPIQWVKMLKDEIFERPLFCEALTVRGSGHAFIFDGYGTYGGNDVFHVNFGWSGYCNGYYYYYDLDAGGGHDYSYDLGAIFDLYPAPLSSYKYSLQYDDSDIPGGLAFDGPFDPSGYSIINFGFLNTSYTTYNGTLAAKLIGRNGLEKADFEFYVNGEFGWTDHISGLPVGYVGYSQYQIKLPDSPKPTIEFGDRIVLYCTTDEAQEVFEPVKELKDGSVLNALPIIPAAFMKTNPSGYSLNDYFEFELMNNDYVYAGTVWTITEPDGTINSGLAQSSRRFQFTQTGTYKIEAAVAPTVGGDIIETITTYITVSE